MKNVNSIISYFQHVFAWIIYTHVAMSFLISSYSFKKIMALTDYFVVIVACFEYQHLLGIFYSIQFKNWPWYINLKIDKTEIYATQFWALFNQSMNLPGLILDIFKVRFTWMEKMCSFKLLNMLIFFID